MSDYIDTREGWREVSLDHLVKGVDHLNFTDADGHTHLWVREYPVPPLPTDPYTVIRVSWKAGGTYRLALDDEEKWWFIGTEDGLMPDTLARKITGFEILAEPRKTTAKAMYDFLFNVPDYYGAQRVAREFGVKPND